MTHPLSARLVLLAAAAALAASLVFAMIVAEHRDLDGSVGLGGVAGAAAKPSAEAAAATRAERLRVVELSAGR